MMTYEDVYQSGLSALFANLIRIDRTLQNKSYFETLKTFSSLHLLIVQAKVEH